MHNTDFFSYRQEAAIPPPQAAKNATAKKDPVSPAPAASPEVSHLASEAAPGGQLKLRRFLAFYQQELEVVHLCHFSSLPFRWVGSIWSVVVPRVADPVSWIRIQLSCR